MVPTRSTFRAQRSHAGGPGHAGVDPRRPPMQERHSGGVDVLCNVAGTGGDKQDILTGGHTTEVRLCCLCSHACLHCLHCLLPMTHDHRLLAGPAPLHLAPPVACAVQATPTSGTRCLPPTRWCAMLTTPVCCSRVLRGVACPGEAWGSGGTNHD